MKIIFLLSTFDSLETNVLTFADLKLVRRSPREPPRMCIHFNYLWKSWRIINSRENCEMRSSGPWRESASSNRYGLILSSKMICSFYYSKQLWSAVYTHIFASYLLARIAMLEIIVCCILALCLVCTKKKAFSRWLNTRRICFYLRPVCGATRASERKKQNN